jgi:Type IV secretion-system coupling protein DNA-binding domain/Toxin SymE, type I toxin-antitoxin system
MANTQPTPVGTPTQHPISPDSAPISDPRPEIRRLTVSRSPTDSSPATPMVRLQGRWLEHAGFVIGCVVKVHVSCGRLVIETAEPERVPQAEALERIARVSEGGVPKRELDAVGAIDGLKDALARLRKFGGRCVLGFQSIAQVSSTYGAGEAQTIVENCGNTLILRCSASEGGGTSRFASQLIGDREIVRTETSRGLSRPTFLSGSGGSYVSDSVTHRHVTEATVMPSEIEQLPDLVGFLKVASSPAWMRVAFTARP